jgi:predicted methyltransferase MtxX (methanogen marker protein 4)
MIGVVAADNERGYLKAVDKSLDEADEILKAMKPTGYACRNYPLRIDVAATECNIVVPMDGILGNFVCRSLVFLGGAAMVGGFGLTPQFVSIDTSRSIGNYTQAIKAAVAMCNLGGMPVDEYERPGFSTAPNPLAY